MKIVRQLFLFSVAFALTLALCEVFIQVTHLASVSSTDLYDDIGRGRRKNLDYVYFNEGFGVGTFNEYRYIGEANPPEKKPKTIRVVLLGDSYVESFQVFERDYFGNIAERMLEKQYPQYRFEFLNFGRSGFDITNVYAYQKTFAEQFNPDYIFYMVCQDDLDPKYSDPLRPKTVVENDSLQVSFAFSPQEVEMFEKTKFLTQNSTIFNMINNGRKRTEQEPAMSIILEKVYYWFNDIPERKEPETPADYQPPVVTQKIVKSLDPSKVIVVNRDKKELAPSFVNLVKGEGLQYLDLSHAFDSSRTRGVDPIEWHVTKKRGHWNLSGHRIVARQLANHVSAMMKESNKDDVMVNTVLQNTAQ
jgi:hypothetical protein